MKPALVVGLVVIAATASAYGGFWFAHRQSGGMSASPGAEMQQQPSAGAPSRKILYYKSPMGKPDFSAVPKKDEMGMDYLPVYEDEETSPETAASGQAQKPPSDRKILYYRNPMGLPDTSSVPKKDSMGMDYIPVFEAEEQGDQGVVKVSPARVQMLGVRSEAAALRKVARPVSAVGTIQFSERQLTVVSTKFEGWIEQLYVSATGETVKRGEPLMRIYSPLLVQTEQEYLDAARMADSMRVVAGADQENHAGAARLVEGALQRLRNLDVPELEIQRLQREGKAARTIAWPAPFSGVVLEKSAFEGMRFMPGEPLYRIAGLSPIWVIAEVFEQDLAQVAVGQPARITVKAYPGRTFQGRVAQVYPSVGTQTRTGRLRVELPNPKGELKADMSANVELDTDAHAPDVVTVPDTAVIDNGIRQVVLIERGAGRFEPRPVKLGARASGYAVILEGVQAGERVVVSANFLIDAESNLKAALGSFTAGEHQHE